jgi:hypothetical protein
MNRKQLIILVLALVVLGGACLLLLNRNQESWSSSGNKLGHKVLTDFQVNDVVGIHIKSDIDLDLVKKDDRWRVQQRNNYPANFSQVSDLLIKASDLKIAQAEPIDPSQMARMHLDEPGKGPDAATLLEFKDAQGKTMQSLLLGKKHTRQSNLPSPMPGMDGEYPDGRFVMLKGDPDEVLTVSDPLSSVDPKPSEWLDKDFFKIEKPNVIALVSTNAADSWSLSRTNENAPWVLASLKTGEVLDTNKVSSLSSTLGYPSFVDVVSDPATAKTSMDKPLVVTIQTFDGFVYTLKIGAKTPENEYNFQVQVAGDFPTNRVKGAESPDAAKSLDKLFEGKMKQVEDKLKQEKSLDGWTYLVNNWLIDPLIRTRAQLMVEKKTDKEKKEESATPSPSTEAPGVTLPALEPGPNSQ